MIILEGMDGCGKSTLASKIGLQVIHPGAPPKGAEDEAKLFANQQGYSTLPVVFDRVTCISQQVYRKRMFDERYSQPLRRLIDSRHCVIVHCRPPDEFVLDIDNHTVSPHDTLEMLQLVRDNAQTFLASYDRLMESIPHVVYDFTKTDLEDFMSNIRPTQYHLSEWQKCMNQLKVTPKFS